jgi:phage tail-like protein
MDLSVRLLDEKGEPLRAWDVINAYPVKWETEGFKSTKNEIAIEIIELSYNFSNRVA